MRQSASMFPPVSFLWLIGPPGPLPETLPAWGYPMTDIPPLPPPPKGAPWPIDPEAPVPGE